MPSQIALLAEVEIGPFLDDQGRFAPERTGSELVRRPREYRAHPADSVDPPRSGRPVWVRDPAFDPGRHMTCSSLRPGEDLLGWAAVVDGRRLPRPAGRSSAPAQVEPMGNRRTAPSPSVRVSPPRTADSGVSDPSSS